MPKITRKKTFETNSSSAHSLVIMNEPKLDDVPNVSKVTLDLSTNKYTFTDESVTPAYHRDFRSKLAFIYLSILVLHANTCNIVLDIPEDKKELFETEINCSDTDGIAFLSENKIIQSADTLSYFGTLLWKRVFNVIKKNSSIQDIKLVQSRFYDFYDLDDEVACSIPVDEKYLPYSEVEGRTYEVSPCEYVHLNNLGIPVGGCGIPLQFFFDEDMITRFLFNSDSHVKYDDVVSVEILLQGKKVKSIGLDWYDSEGLNQTLMDQVLTRCDFILDGKLYYEDKNSAKVLTTSTLIEGK